MDNNENHAIRSAVINKAINYIFDHIDEEITVDDVAHYCSYSRYHLTRMFKEQTLFMVYQEIFCRWLSRTGNQLDEKRPILDIYRVVREDGYMEIDICFPLK